MARIVSVHSFRGGTGKSNTTANVAAVLAQSGLRVGVIDTDIQSPGIHVLFGLSGEQSDRLAERLPLAQPQHQRGSPGCVSQPGRRRSRARSS